MVPDTMKGGSATFKGVAKEEGGGSMIHVTVRSFKKAEMWSDYEDITKRKQGTGDKPT